MLIMNNALGRGIAASGEVHLSVDLYSGLIFAVGSGLRSW